MNIILTTFKNNKAKFSLIYLIFFIIILATSLFFYRYSLNKVATIVATEIKNYVLNDDFAQVKSSLARLVPEVFDEIKIIKNNKLIFSVKESDPYLYMDLTQTISPSKSILNGSSVATVIFRLSFYPQIFISAIISLIAFILTLPFLHLEYRKNELINRNNYFSLSRKIVHDIRSPLSTLNLISSKIERSDIRELQLAVIDQINRIADKLLNDTKVETFLSYQQIFKQIENELEVKKTSLGVDIKFFIHKKFSNLHTSAPKFLYSTLNNLIRNSIEASDGNAATVKICADILDNWVVIKISDNGVGIPEQVLLKLGKEEVTFGKDLNGNGIGFFNAYKDIVSINGKMTIISELGLGTEITILLPSCG